MDLGLEQIYFKLCSDHLSVEAIPKSRVQVDFVKMKHDVSQLFEMVMWTPHFVVVRNRGGQEITVRRDGRMLVRKAGSETVAREAAAEMFALVLRNFQA